MPDLAAILWAGRTASRHVRPRRELISRRPDVLLSVPTTFVKALLQETTATPIVMVSTPDPVRPGLVTNLSRPNAGRGEQIRKR